MTGLRRALVALGAVGAALTALAILLVSGSDHMEHPTRTAMTGAFVMASWIGVGLYAWYRRPDNRVGILMTATGFAAFIGSLAGSSEPVVYGIGIALETAYIALAVHLLLAFPSGKLTSTPQRWLLAGAYLVSVGVGLAYVLLDGDCGCDLNVPDNGLGLWHAPDAAEAVRTGGSLIGAALIVAVAVVLLRRWRRSSSRERRVLAPVLLTGAYAFALFALLITLSALGYSGLAGAVSWGALLGLAGLPFAFLAGLQTSRAWREGAMTDLLGTLGEAPVRGDLRDVLADALADPTLELAYWLPERGRWVDAGGHPITLPTDDDPQRAVTEVEREGAPVAALVHTRALCDDPELLRVMSSAAALALANERLDAELRARVEELRRSREFLIETSLAERRSLERDLHDGAQQRLVSLALQLGLIDKQLERGAESLAVARETLDGARGEAKAALEDLRELARGIHPAVLTDRGLQAALEALADRAPVPVEVEVAQETSLPGPVDAAAYFVVSEALANIAKYAQAGQATVRVDARNGDAVIEVRDDGVGGADPDNGTGLRGLADRLAALDGRLEVESPPGRGTLVRARIPCRT